MGTVNVVLGEDTRLNLILGQQLENAVTSVVFDFSAWQTTYGSGTLALSVQRPGDEMPYAVPLTTSGTNATWSVTNLDTAYKGVGHIQLTYTVGSAIKKSVVYKFTVYESLGANGEYPSPGQTWQEEMEQEITDVKTDLAQISGGGVTKAQWDMMIELFRGAVYDTTIIADPKSVIDDLEDSIENIPSTGLTLSTSTVSATSTDVVTVTATLTPANTTDSIHAVSDDTDVCTVSVNNKSINITPVGDGTATVTVTTDSGISKTISVSCDLPTLYTVTNNLTGCTSSNSATQISEGSDYSAILTVDDETYSFTSATITVGGVDVTSSVWDSSTGEISITNVTGAVVITVVAEVRIPEYGIVFPASYVPVYSGFFKSATARPHQFDTMIFDMKISSQTGSKVFIKGLTSSKWAGIDTGNKWNNPWGETVTPLWDSMTWGVRTDISFGINIAESSSPSTSGQLGWQSGNSMNPAMTLYGIKCLSNGNVVVNYKAQSNYTFKDTISETVITPDVTTGLDIEEVE